MRLPTSWQKRKKIEQDRRASAVSEQWEARREEDRREANAQHQKIVAALERIDQRQELWNQKSRPQSERAETWERRNFWLEITGVAIAIGAAAILWFTLDAARRATVEANRAWMAPRTIHLLSPLVLNQKPVLRLTFDNVGRAPALKADLRGRFVTARAADVLAALDTPSLWTKNFGQNACALP